MYLVITALLAAGTIFILLQIIAVSQQAQRQTEIEQVAHYAAEGMALIAARDLNLKAITNRAMVANEMAIGQIIGLHSWYEMSRETSTNMAMVTAWVPYLNSITTQLAQMLNRMREPMRVGVRGAVTVQQFIINGLSSAQQVFHQASWLASIATGIDIVEGTDEQLELVLLHHQTLLSVDNIWLRMQRSASAVSDQQDYVAMVAASRDPFSERRTYRWVNLLNVEAHRAGGSEINLLGEGRVSWRSLDTSQLHINFLLHNLYVPIGGGASYLQERLPSSRRSSGFGDSYQINWTASRYTARKQHDLQVQHRSPRYFRYQHPKTAPQITAVVRRRGTSNEAEPQQWGAGRVELYYRRPAELWPRQDGARETANLHNALWQVRRKPLSHLEKQIIGAQL